MTTTYTRGNPDSWLGQAGLTACAEQAKPCRSMVTDRKIAHESLTTPGLVDYFLAEACAERSRSIVSSTDYYPGVYTERSRSGMQMDNRSFSSPNYRYGFNGKEKDPEGMGGGGAIYDYGFRIYNSSIGRFLSVDPLNKKFPYYSPYHFSGNKPISCLDLDGLEDIYFAISFTEKLGETVINYLNATKVGKELLNEFKNTDPNKGEVNIGYDLYVFPKPHMVMMGAQGGIVAKIDPGELMYPKQTPESKHGPTILEQIVKYQDGKLTKKEEDALRMRISSYFDDDADLTQAFMSDKNLKESSKKGRGIIFVGIDESKVKYADSNTDVMNGLVETIGHEIGAHAVEIARGVAVTFKNTIKQHVKFWGSSSRVKPGSKEDQLNKEVRKNNPPKKT